MQKLFGSNFLLKSKFAIVKRVILLLPRTADYTLTWLFTLELGQIIPSINSVASRYVQAKETEACDVDPMYYLTGKQM